MKKMGLNLGNEEDGPEVKAQFRYGVLDVGRRRKTAHSSRQQQRGFGCIYANIVFKKLIFV